MKTSEDLFKAQASKMTVQMNTQMDDIPFVDVTVRLESLQDDLFQVAQAISPTARREKMTFKELQGRFIE